MMNHLMHFPRLVSFLELYLQVQPRGDLKNALREFLKDQPDAVEEFLGELRGALASGTSDAEFRQLLASEGNYRIPDEYTSAESFLAEVFDLLQVLGPARSAQRPFDVFISYSSTDRPVAERLARELRRHGFTVWLDSWEILVGHNVVDEVYKGIRSSEFMIVLLSQKSSQSRWVTEELTAGRLGEIEEQQIRVLPALIEKCDIPDPLKAKRHADLSTDWAAGLRELLGALHVLRFELRWKNATAPAVSRSVERLDQFYTAVLANIRDAGWVETEALKDVVIGPPDDAGITVPRQELMKLVDDCRVDLQNYGGPSFPFDPYPRTTVNRLSDGVRVYDAGPSSFADWSFMFWGLTDEVRFASRSSIEEDHLLDERGGKIAMNSLEVSWLLKDLCRPLMFAHRLAVRLKMRSPLLIRLVWQGIRGRRLISLSRRRVPLMNVYESSANEYRKEMWIDPKADLQAIALGAAGELFWQFGWEQFPRDTTMRDIRSILDGRFPD